MRVYPRRTRPRSLTISVRRLRREGGSGGSSGGGSGRPLTRGDCLPGGCNEARPCPFVGCRFHLFLDVNPETGSIKVNFPDREPGELVETCALDVADRGVEQTLDDVGDAMNLTRERVRQIETAALEYMAEQLAALRPAHVPPGAQVLHPHAARQRGRRIDLGTRRFPERDARIKERLEAGESAEAVAAAFSLSVSTVQFIRRGRRRIP